jgi:integrase
MFKRGKIWYFSINGVKESSGTSDRERARALERKRQQEAWDRANGFHVKAWDEACLEWLEGHQHLTSYPQNKQLAKWWLPHLTGLKLTAITKDLIHRVIVRHRPIDPAQHIKANSTANFYVAFVEKIIRAGSQLRPEFTIYPEPGNAKRWLRQDEWAALEAEMDDDLRHVCTLALGTGLREANDMLFAWDWIHGTAAYLPRQITKTREDYGIPLGAVVQGVIEQRRQAKVRHPELVFLNRGKVWNRQALRDRLNIAVKASGIAPMTFHTFRHTFASWLAQKGVSDAVRRRLGCWSTGSDAASGYVHFDVESLRPFSEMVFPIQSQGQSQDVDSETKSA